MVCMVRFNSAPRIYANGGVIALNEWEGKKAMEDMYRKGLNDGYTMCEDNMHDMAIRHIRYNIKRLIKRGKQGVTMNEFEYTETRCYSFISAYNGIQLITFREYEKYFRIVAMIDNKYRKSIASK